MYSVVYQASESMEVQGSHDEVMKKYGKEWRIKPLGNGNGNWLLTKNSDILINGKSYRAEILAYFSREKLTEKLAEKIENDLHNGKTFPFLS